jgi:hypothetical protein
MLGHDPIWGGYFDGNIAEVLVFNRTLTTAERVTVNAYLNSKYALVPGVPATPTNLVAAAISPTQIGLVWNEPLNGGATQVSVERKTGSGGTYAVVAQVVNALSYVDTNLVAGTTYYYRVRALNLTTWSPYSNETNATTLSAGPDIPLGNLLFWLKADSGMAQIGTNTPVSFWADQSGQTNNASQPISGNQPSWVAGALNGNPVVHFDGASSYLNIPTFMVGTTQAEEFVVLKVTTNLPSATRALWRMGSASGYIGYPNTSGQIVEGFGNNQNYTVGVPSEPLTQYHVYEVAGQSGDWAAWINGVLQAEVLGNVYGYYDGSYSPAPGCMLGHDPIWGGYFDGNIAEVLVFNRPLTLDEKNITGKYLAYKYNLSLQGTNLTAPSTPTNFVATGFTPYQINLQWSLASSNVSSFELERKLGTNGTYQEIVSVPGTVTNFLDNFYSPTNQFFYRVKARNFLGDSPYSVEISPPLAIITNPPAQSVYSTGTNITINVATSDLDGTVTQVNFLINGNISLASTNAPFSVVLTNFPAGVYCVVAQPIDNQGNRTLSTIINLVVSPDTDGDGINDFQEILMGTDPTNPLDPGSWTPPGSSTAPTINLIEPGNAVLVP